ncbi:MAG: sigma-54 dependent transcriptional regulator [Methyloprofundus sp.]|nr:sigma-54 dependent transcriptional regulator [Methyloprofundus sp.]
MATARIILIDDNKERQEQFSAVIEFLEYEIVHFTSANFSAGLDLLADSFAVFIGAGLKQQAKILKEINHSAATLPIILLVAKGEALKQPSKQQKLVQSIQEWPVTYSELMSSFQQLKIEQNHSLLQSKTTKKKPLVGSSTLISQVCFLISQVANSDATVLILGESGTGKELVARALHQESTRKDKPFVPINCGAIPAELLESELFGHEKGDFTGALASRKGRFEMAEGGTLFLDEIGDMPMPMQVKLLRVLQERTYERVGGSKTYHCDVRIISATHRDIEEAIEKDLFRQDLFYRLNVFPIEVPALRERVEDIPLLVDDLIAQRKAVSKAGISIGGEVLNALSTYDWPGNIRELANLIERLTIIKPNESIDLSDLPKKIRQMKEAKLATEDFHDYMKYSGEEAVEGSANKEGSTLGILPNKGIDLKSHLHQIEVSLIQQALDDCHGVVAHAAKKLNMRRTTLVEKIKKLDL